MSNFALAIEKLLLCYGVLLGYGVMVTLQIPVILGSSPSIPTADTQSEASVFSYSILLGYGVMVTLQILVLSFLVRVRVSQQQFEHHPTRVMLFLFIYTPIE